LLARMTLEEKIGQLCIFDGKKSGDWLRQKHVGALINVVGEKALQMQKEIGDRHRLRIPVLFGLDCIHGHALYPEATVFPTQLAMACSWNPGLVEQIGHITAKEMSVTGIHWTFSPVLDLARDLRWGRIDETFGEDPCLAGVLGTAMVRGYQGEKLSAPDSVLACAKHFAGYCESIGGRDSTETVLSRRQLRADILPPYEMAIAAGCATVMAGYQSLDGLPCSANKWLLTDLLRDEMNFNGFVVSDWNNIGYLIDTHRVCATPEQAAQTALTAGNDMAMGTDEFPDAVLNAVKTGKIEISVLDEACRRILSAKMALGLFDDKRYPDLGRAEIVVGCGAHLDVSLEAASQSIVLLENRGHILPLKPDIGRIAVVGPNAEDVLAQLGDWALGMWFLTGWMDPPVTPNKKQDTILGAIRARVGDQCEVTYFKGCDVLDSGHDDLAGAVRIAEQADVTIAVVGDSRDLVGECRDRSDLGLSGKQQALLEAVYATGKPLVVILVSSKPLAIPWIAKHAHALLAAWNPGTRGGTALASILFGDRNPCGKLAVSFPWHVGQMPVRYNQPPGWHGRGYCIDLPAETKNPLYAFGYGVSYTSYAYSNLRLESEKLQGDEPLQFTIDVENTGQRPGTEIIQVYVRDCVASVTRPLKQLKGFSRVDLNPGEKKTVPFEISHASLAVIDAEGRRVVEPGDFELMVGPSSRDEDLLNKQIFKVI